MQQRIHRQQEGSLIYYTSDNITTKHLFTTKFGGVSKDILPRSTLDLIAGMSGAMFCKIIRFLRITFECRVRA